MNRDGHLGGQAAKKIDFFIAVVALLFGIKRQNTNGVIFRNQR